MEFPPRSSLHLLISSEVEPVNLLRSGESPHRDQEPGSQSWKHCAEIESGAKLISDPFTSDALDVASVYAP